MWDTTMKWLENSGVNVQSNSKDWGNYADSSIKGITEYFRTGGSNWVLGNTETEPDRVSSDSDSIGYCVVLLYIM